MAKQTITFEHGGSETGDSGARDSQEAIKPYHDGERARSAVFNRPTENMRVRTETLRSTVEELLYKDDAGMRWIISGVLSQDLVPKVGNFNITAGTFEVDNALVVQPLNTPKQDMLASKVYTFTPVAPEVTPVTVTFTSTRRAYDLGNDLNIKWIEKPVGELSGAVVPGYCDVTFSGDPELTVIVTIRDDAATEKHNLSTAFSAGGIAPRLAAMGLTVVVVGPNTGKCTYTDIPTAYRDYFLVGTYECELHKIMASVLNAYVAANPLGNGDSLAIWFNYDNTPAPDTDGRRQCTPSNANIHVSPGNPGELFITSNNPENIPNCIPLCKRVADRLYWLDGTVVTAAQATSMIEFGENGHTVNMILADIWAQDATITGNWRFDAPVSHYRVAVPDTIRYAQAPLTTLASASRYVPIQEIAAITSVTAANAGIVVSESQLTIQYTGAGALYTSVLNSNRLSLTQGQYTTSSSVYDGAYALQGIVALAGDATNVYATPIAGVMSHVRQVGNATCSQGVSAFTGGFTVEGPPTAVGESWAGLRLGNEYKRIGANTVLYGVTTATLMTTGTLCRSLTGSYNSVDLSGEVSHAAVGLVNEMTLGAASVVGDRVYGYRSSITHAATSSTAQDITGNYSAIRLYAGPTGDVVLYDNAVNRTDNVSVYTTYSTFSTHANKNIYRKSSSDSLGVLADTGSGESVSVRTFQRASAGSWVTFLEEEVHTQGPHDSKPSGGYRLRFKEGTNFVGPRMEMYCAESGIYHAGLRASASSYLSQTSKEYSSTVQNISYTVIRADYYDYTSGPRAAPGEIELFNMSGPVTTVVPTGYRANSGIKCQGMYFDMSKMHRLALPEDDETDLALVSAKNGQIFYDSTALKVRIYIGGAWKEIPTT